MNTVKWEEKLINMYDADIKLVKKSINQIKVLFCDAFRFNKP